MRPMVIVAILAALAGTAAAGTSELRRYYPAHAARHNIEGEVLLACAVQADGTLRPCAVKSEEPPGEDFGAAALKMSAHFRMKPLMKDGQPVGGGQVSIPIHFRLPH